MVIHNLISNVIMRDVLELCQSPIFVPSDKHRISRTHGAVYFTIYTTCTGIHKYISIPLEPCMKLYIHV